MTEKISAKYSFVGAVCGRMDLGLIAGCRGFGSAESENGSYAGGIAWHGNATIRGCFVKCSLSGKSYVGGIVGSGLERGAEDTSSTVTGCYSMVEITDCEQYSGAISGRNAGEFLGCILPTPNAPGQRVFSRCAAPFFLEIRQYSCGKMSCSAQKLLAAGHIGSWKNTP